MTGREKGVVTVPCPTCGNDLPVVERADGGVTPERCSSCYPTTSTERASAPAPVGRERGVVPDENPDPEED
jgi:hypothetical protein